MANPMCENHIYEEGEEWEGGEIFRVLAVRISHRAIPRGNLK